MKATGLLITFSTAMLSLPAFAEDASEFDIAGIKLGMQPAQAANILKERCMKDKGKYSFDSVGAPHPYEKGKKYPAYATCDTDNENIQVSFRPVPDKGIVTCSISYGIPFNQQNMKSLRESAIGKYGPPSNIHFGSGPIGDSEWCSDAKPAYKGGPACLFSKVPNLRVGLTNMSLSDPNLCQAALKYRQQMETIKPNF